MHASLFNGCAVNYLLLDRHRPPIEVLEGKA